MQVIYNKQALDDQLREIHFWMDQSPELGQKLLDELEQAIETIKASPNGFYMASSERNIRRFVEGRFHTTILYRFIEDRDELRILRFYNSKMNPIKFL